MGDRFVVLASLLLLSVPLVAQSSAEAPLAPVLQARRVDSQADLTSRRQLRGHVAPWVRRAALSSAAVDPNSIIDVTFTLTRSRQAQAAFDQMLVDQQDSTSPSYHKWLTAAQIGEIFGPVPADIGAFTAWLTAQGFAVGYVAPSGMFVRASASASSVARALDLQFANYVVEGEIHRAAASEPSLPAALEPLVAGIHGLDDLPERSSAHVSAPRDISSATSLNGVLPRYTNPTGIHAIQPADFAILYNLRPSSVYLDGSGRRIAIIGRSRVDQRDLSGFALFTAGFSSTPNVVIPPSGMDPLTTGNGDQVEATLDVERVRGTAPGAQIDLVIDSVSSGGIFAAATYAVQYAQYDAMNISFGRCEASASATAVSNWDTLFAQAAAEGTSVFVSSGDTGAAGCDNQYATTPTVQTLSPNYICASSYATCVGGTEFTADLENPSAFWSSTNTSNGSVLGYMAEGAWNEPTSTSTSGVISYHPLAGGGGASQYIAKPAWQTGAGVPNDGQRDTPDVSLSSSLHDGFFGCSALIGGDCNANKFILFYGTSVAAPSMAGITALLNQRLNGRHGNLNPTLYRVAANPGYRAFHDVTVSTSGVSPCDPATPSPCNNSTPGPTSLSGGLAGYVVGPSYDLATGLGSPDVGYLLAAFAAPYPTTISLFASINTVGLGSDLSISAFIGTGSYFPPATGTLTFTYSGGTLGTIQANPSSNSTTFKTNALPVGVFLIGATYSGDLLYSPSAATGNAGTVVTVILPPAFTITAGAGSVTAVAGAATPTNTLTLAAQNGLSGPINLTCTISGVSQPAPPLCLISNATPTLAVNGTATTNISLTATYGLGVLTPPASSRRSLVTLSGVLFVMLLPLCSRRRRQVQLPRLLASVGLSLGLVVSVSGCGGGGNSTPSVRGTAPGSYTVTVAGNGSGVLGPVTAQSTFTLLVQ
jgi:pseudomonalisin